MSLYYRRMTGCDIQWQARTPHFIPHCVLVCQSPYNELKFQQTTMLRNYMGSQSNSRCTLWHVKMTLMKYTFIMFWGTKYQLSSNYKYILYKHWCILYQKSPTFFQTAPNSKCSNYTQLIHQVQRWWQEKIMQRITKVMMFVVKWQVCTLEYIFSAGRCSTVLKHARVY